MLPADSAVPTGLRLKFKKVIIIAMLPTVETVGYFHAIPPGWLGQLRKLSLRQVIRIH